MDNDLSKEDIERIGMANIVHLNHQKLQTDIAEQAAANERAAVHGELATKILETQLLQVRESMRPHRLYHATIGKDKETGKYFCRLLEFENPEEEPFEISAHGDSPAAACDNFDALWMGMH